MTKDGIIKEIMNETGLKRKDAEKFMEGFIGIVSKELAAGRKVKLHGLGVFEVRHRKGRTGRNPATGEAMDIKPGLNIKFTAGKPLKNTVNSMRAKV